MKVLYVLFVISVMGLFSTAYAQNISNDEEDIMIRELIQECQDRVDVDEKATEAEKTVAKRNCETEITNKYKNVEIDYKDLAEKRANLNIMQSCEDWYPQYRYLTQEQFRLQKHEATVNDCIIIYNDSIWNYNGEDRLEKLSSRLLEIKAELPKEPPTRHVELDVNIPKLESKTLQTPNDIDENDLKERIKFLEAELVKKDEIINEQIRVIMDLANRIKNVMFSQFNSFFAHL